jgi:hypothetical protein
MNAKDKTPNEIPYSRAKQVKGNNLTTGEVIGIVAAIGVAVIVLIIAGRN